MIQSFSIPDRPHFIFSGKMWEIRNIYDNTTTNIVFEHITKTGMIAPDEGFNGDNEGYWTFTEVVEAKISGDYDEPIISLYKQNSGTRVLKGDIKEIEPLGLPLFVIEKLVREAEKMHFENRRSHNYLTPKEIRKEIQDNT